MFDFLKKKISDFTGKLAGTLQGKQEEQARAEQKSPEQTEEKKPLEKKETKPEEKPKQESESVAKPVEVEPARQKTGLEEKKEKAEPKEKKATPENQASKEPVTEKIETTLAADSKQEPAKATPKAPEKKSIKDAIFGFLGKKKGAEKQKPEEIAKPKEVLSKPQVKEPPAEIKKEPKAPLPPEKELSIEEKIRKIEIREEEKRGLKAETGIFRKITGIVLGKIKITEKDTQDFFDELELSLLESDVEQETAFAIVKQLRSQLVGREIASNENLSEFLNTEIKKALEVIMQTEKIDLENIQNKPLKILFIGPNGAGKTTSIAKLANYFLKKNKSVILAAGDTFRAAAIAQLETHANRLGVKIVKQNYGADPAAVAFDAVAAAQAKGIDIVLIDTAGRQETNTNLIEELKKIERVVKPDLKIYVGEAYTGQALLQQAQEFNQAIGLDGFILTKIDTDAKGGTAISLLYTLKKPILFVGTGQEYDDLLEFTPKFIIDRII